MSLLYLGYHPKEKKTLIIKTLSPQFVKHKEMKGNFLKEASIIALTNHPNIVKLYTQEKIYGWYAGDCLTITTVLDSRMAAAPQMAPRCLSPLVEKLPPLVEKIAPLLD